MAEFMKHYKVLLNKAKVDLKAALNLQEEIDDIEKHINMLVNALKVPYI